MVALVLVGSACTSAATSGGDTAAPQASLDATTAPPAVGDGSRPASAGTDVPPPEGATPTQTEDRTGPIAQFPVETVGEASGLAVSRRTPGIAWVLDDGPGTSGVLAASYGPAGDTTATGLVEVAGLDAVDAEALAVGDCAADDARSCLYIGDVGDNRRNRQSVQVHRLVEPDLSDGLPGEPVPADTVTLTYPDGPTDAEAMFSLDGRLFIVSKAPFDADSARTGAARLYELPIFTDGDLRARGEVPVPQPSIGIASAVVGNVVTGADAMTDRVVLRTYDHAVRYTAPSAGADPATFPTWPFTEIPSDGPLQTEAVAIDPGPCATLTVGEGSGRIWRTPCPVSAAAADG